MKKLLFILLLLPVVVRGQIITTIIGTGTPGYSGDGGLASAAQLYYPYCIKLDAYGNKYIADKRNHVVRKVNTAGIITTIAGNGNGAGTITGGYSGDGGAATNAELSSPTDLAFDDAGNLYIAEEGNSVIRKVNTAGIITTIAGTGVSGFSGDGGPAVNAKISLPLGLVFDKKGNLYFSNNGSRVVRKINTSGIISTIAGTGVAGYSGDGGPATAAKLNLVGFLEIDDTGNLYIPAYSNYRIRKVDTFGIISTVIGNGMGGNGGDGGSATAANIGNSWGIVSDKSNNMYISNWTAPVVRKITNAGIISTVAGIGTQGYGGDGGPAVAAQFNSEMRCSAVDNWGNLYIVDPYNNRIRRVTYDVSAVNTVSDGMTGVHIYPNPAKDELYIITTYTAAYSISSIEGRHIAGGILSSGDNLVSLRALLPGIYIIELQNNGGGRVMKRLVKE